MSVSRAPSSERSSTSRKRRRDGSRRWSSALRSATASCPVAHTWERKAWKRSGACSGAARTRAPDLASRSTALARSCTVAAASATGAVHAARTIAAIIMRPRALLHGDCAPPMEPRWLARPRSCATGSASWHATSTAPFSSDSRGRAAALVVRKTSCTIVANTSCAALVYTSATSALTAAFMMGRIHRPWITAAPARRSWRESSSVSQNHARGE
mmetsp:Transcript_3071/g.10091  ORF Transcript_3071/g.10091 Transcript_3071/m.10091 type:complete len:214 (-) Transcript_3071:1839-2480(-)